MKFTQSVFETRKGRENFEEFEFREGAKNGSIG